jgi:hypothetical protein
MQRLISLSLAGIAFASLLGGCASTPRFEPSAPIDAAPSYQEALLLCDEYRVPYPAERPVALKPLVECIDEAGERPGAPVSGGFATFRRELSSRYDSLSEWEWTPKLGVELGAAIHAALRSLWQPRPVPAQLGTIEKDLFLRHFPRTARALEVEHWAAERNPPAVDRRLETLRAGLAAASDQARRPQEPFATGSAAQSCRELRRLRQEESYLTELWRDLGEYSRLQPGAELGNPLRSRYRLRVETALKELQQIRPLEGCPNA